MRDSGADCWHGKRGVLRRNRERKREMGGGERGGTDSERTRKTNSSENTLVNTRNIDAMFSVACSAHGSALPFCEWRGVSFLCRDYFYRRKPLSLSLERKGLRSFSWRKQRGIPLSAGAGSLSRGAELARCHRASITRV